MPMQKMCNNVQKRNEPANDIMVHDDIIVIDDDEDDSIEINSETCCKRSITMSPTPTTDETAENSFTPEADCKIEDKLLETEIKIEDIEDELTSEFNPQVGDQDSDVVIISDTDDSVSCEEVKIEINEETQRCENDITKGRSFDSLNDHEKITLLCFYEVNCEDEIIDRTLVSSTFNCLLCRFKTNRETRLIEHVSVKHNRRKLQCAFCGFGTFHDAIMSEHFKYRHSGSDENSRSKNSSSSAENCVLNKGKNHWNCKCNMCQLKLKNNHSVRRYRQRRMVKYIRCYSCEFKTTTKAILRRHILKMHRK